MALEIDRVRVICFDVDGTLSDTDDLLVSRIVYWFRFLRIIYSHKKIKIFARRLVMALESPTNWVYEILDCLELDGILAGMMHFFAERKPKRNNKYLLIPGVEKMLMELVAKYPMAVVSARDEATTTEFLNKFDIKKFFELVVTSQTCKHTKPFPDPLLYATGKLKAIPQNCLMVGDTPVDIKTGKRAGAQTVGVLCGFGTQGELVRAGADFILSTTADLSKLLL